ncbi:SurA N-terminal domain-containing protein [Ideonella paludis]|uniref:Periplasmic chaperone PpiD n=1 Tax=Ideonella paludis TaxID=1233411 RepID=A0ABS5E2K3_9BURK|nr:SurA N-terminal domain-containing protein [Ideonella paludis]MBQ0937647.1 SurA N-terminal domain-containing protein [Ideonella paludis]
MFDFVRDHKRWLQFLLVLLIFPSFVFFGVQGYSSFMDASNQTVAEIAGGEIKQSELEAAHRQQIERIRQQMPNVDVKMFDTPEMKRSTLDGLVRERVLATAAAKSHLLVSDERLAAELQRMPELAKLRGADGKFDTKAYGDMLAQQGYTPASFEAAVRRDMTLRQVTQGVTGSQIVGAVVTGTALDAMLERREVQIQRFNMQDYMAKVQPTDADIEAFYKAHSAEFRSAEEASIEYTVLDLEVLKKQVTLNDADLLDYYENNKKAGRYTTPEERRASHILIAADKDAKPEEKAAAKAKAESLLAEVRKAPGSFAEVAKKNSQDPGSAPNGGDLDYFGRNAMTKPFEDAAFALKVDEISNVVESEFGYHIIRLTGRRGGDVKPFEAVKAEIVAEVTTQKAKEAYLKEAEAFTNTVYEQSDSLQPVIDKYKLVKSQAVVRKSPTPGAAGPLASQKLLDAIFSAESIKNKRNTEAVETAPNQLVSARIVEHKPERVLPLAEVKAQVQERVRVEQATKAAAKDGEARLAAVKANANEVLSAPQTVSRTQAQNQPRQVIEAVLKADISKGPAVVGVDLGNQGYAVVKVTKLVPREAADPDNERAKPYVAQALAKAEEAAYYEALKRRMKVKITAAGSTAAAASAPSAGG